MFTYIYYNNELRFIFENFQPTRCCEVFADVNAIYFTSLPWTMNASSGIETLKTKLLEKRILTIFLL